MIDYQIPAKFIQENSFLVQARDGKKLAGEAIFSRERETISWVWRARVDVKSKYRRQGIASQLLTEGDQYISTNFPGDAREFNNLNTEASFGYKEYTDKIADEKIISFEGNRLRFKP